MFNKNYHTKSVCVCYVFIEYVWHYFNCLKLTVCDILLPSVCVILLVLCSCNSVRLSLKLIKGNLLTYLLTIKVDGTVPLHHTRGSKASTHIVTLYPPVPTTLDISRESGRNAEHCCTQRKTTSVSVRDLKWRHARWKEGKSEWHPHAMLERTVP